MLILRRWTFLISPLGGLVAWPLASYAQRQQTRRVAVLAAFVAPSGDREWCNMIKRIV